MVAKDRSLRTPSETLSQRLARNIAARRRALNLTQAQLAERLEIDTETLSRFERGKHLPSLAALERIAQQLQTTMSQLLEETVQETAPEAESVTAWLTTLSPDDRAFATQMLKLLSDHLGKRG